MSKLLSTFTLVLLTINPFHIDELFEIDNFERNVYQKNNVLRVLEWTIDSNDIFLSYSCEVNHAGLITEQSYYQKDGSSEIHRATYNASNLLTENLIESSYDNYVGLLEYEYDDQNRVIKLCQSHKKSNQEFFKIDYIEHFEYKNGDFYRVYDSNDSLIRYFERDGERLNQYTSQNTLYTSYGKQDQIFYWPRSVNLRLERDSSLRKIKQEETNKKGDVLKSHSFEYQYNAGGLITDIIETDKEGNLVKRTEYEYRFN